MSENILRCYHCNSSFNFSHSHSGFSDEHFFYCDRCGITAVVEWYTKEYQQFYKEHIEPSYDPSSVGDLAKFEEHTRKTRAVLSQHLQPCPCGGRYSVDAIPRCPHCRKAMEWDKVFDQIAEAFRARGYHPENLEGGWHGVTCFVFDGRVIVDPWAKP